MTIYLDSSVLVAAVIEDEADHVACRRLLARKQTATWSHALAETFATLTGGRLAQRLSPGIAAAVIESLLSSRLRVLDLSQAELFDAIRNAESAGVRGGALYDYLHLVAARQCRARSLFTLNDRHFNALVRRGDPVIEVPV